MPFNLTKKIIDFLKLNPDERFTARQISEWIFAHYPEECQEKRYRSLAKKTPLDSDNVLIQQLVAEIGAHRPDLQRQNPHIKTTEDRPRQYYYTGKSDYSEIEESEKVNFLLSKEEKNNIPTLKGKYALYPKLSEYLFSEFRIYSKRIDEKRASNKHGPKGNKWLYPDLVGIEDLSCDWSREIKDCVKEYSDKKTKLWSFEVKVLINRSNIREVFFQTVSNSSWANFGYLVTGSIQGENTLKELRMLAELHGIGLIQMNIDNPAESQILIPAKEKTEIDWNSANRLAQENKDFLEYIKQVRQFYQTGEINHHWWETNLKLFMV